MYYDYGMGPHMFMHGLGHFLFILLIVAAIIFLVKFFKRGKHKEFVGQCWGKSEALTLLETRYVQGEIDREEYLAKKDDLEGRPHPS